MATWDVFLCHSKKDRRAVIELYRHLIDDGFSVWFDENEILPGDKWRTSIERGISASKIMLICLSTTWVSERSYAHKELRLGCKVTEELPETRPFIIPIRLDDCSVPQSIRDYQWVNLFEEEGYAKLQKSLRLNLKSKTPIKPATGRTIAQMLVEELGFEVVEFEADDPDEEQLLHYFRQDSPLSQSHNALRARQFEEIIKIWECLERNSYFTVLHPAWSIDSRIRAYIFGAKCDLCLAHIHIGAKYFKLEYEPHYRAALDILREVFEMPPFSEENCDLPVDIIQIQNDDYRSLCRSVLNWYSNLGSLISDLSHTPIEDVRAIERAVSHRLGELEKMLAATKNGRGHR